MINAILFWFLVGSCAGFAAFIIWTAWPRKPEKPTRLERFEYECPMPWQQEEFERE